jgi:hypothetical protein
LIPVFLYFALTNPAASLVINGAIFRAYIEQFLAPTLAPDDLVIMDNLPNSRRGCEKPPLATSRPSGPPSATSSTSSHQPNAQTISPMPIMISSSGARRPPAAIIGQLVAMAVEEGCNFGRDSL